MRDYLSEVRNLIHEDAPPADPPELQDSAEYQAVREKAVQQLMCRIDKKPWMSMTFGQKFGVWFGASVVGTLIPFVLAVVYVANRMPNHDPDVVFPMMFLFALVVGQAIACHMIYDRDKGIKKEYRELRSMTAPQLVWRLRMDMEVMKMDYQARAIARESYLSR